MQNLHHLVLIDVVLYEAFIDVFKFKISQQTFLFMISVEQNWTIIYNFQKTLSFSKAFFNFAYD